MNIFPFHEKWPQMVILNSFNDQIFVLGNLLESGTRFKHIDTFIREDADLTYNITYILHIGRRSELHGDNKEQLKRDKGVRTHLWDATKTDQLQILQFKDTFHLAARQRELLREWGRKLRLLRQAGEPTSEF